MNALSNVSTSAGDTNRGNRILGIILLGVAAISVTNPQVRQVYLAHGIDDTGLRVVAGLRVILGATLILGRGRGLVLGLRFGVLAMMTALAVLPAGSKALAYPTFAVVFAGVLALPLERISSARARALRAIGASVAETTCYGVAALLWLSALMCAAAWAVRAGQLPDSGVPAAAARCFAAWPADLVAGYGALQLAAAALLCGERTRRPALATICVGMLAYVGAQMAAGRHDTMMAPLMWAWVSGALLAALPRPIERESASAMLGCRALAAVLAIAALWEFADPTLNGQLQRAGYPPGYGTLQAALYLLAAILLCRTATRRWALLGFGAFCLADGLIGVLQNQPMEAPLAVVLLAACATLLAATERTEGKQFFSEKKNQKTFVCYGQQPRSSM